MTEKSYADLTEWCLQNGAEINKVAPSRIPGRGLGVICTSPIKAGDVLIKIPTALLLYPEIVPRKVRNLFPNITVHGLLAAVLALDDLVDRDWAAWKATMTSRDELEASCPLLWPQKIQDLLPWAAKGHLAEQEQKLQSDFEIVAAVRPELTEHEYRFHWLLVNTRTFYYISTRTKQKPASADCMAMCPFIDYINHADVGCDIRNSAAGFSVKAERNYETGTEIFICYGGHSNDFLLVEYGFTLESNRYDLLTLDPYILPLLSKPQRNLLEESSFLGKYTLDANGICHRTEVALRSKLLSSAAWHDFQLGETDGDKEEDKVDKIMAGVLKRIVQEAVNTQRKILKMRDEVTEAQNAMLELTNERWMQIENLAKQVLQDMEAES